MHFIHHFIIDWSKVFIHFLYLYILLIIIFINLIVPSCINIDCTQSNLQLLFTCKTKLLVTWFCFRGYCIVCKQECQKCCPFRLFRAKAVKFIHHGKNDWDLFRKIRFVKEIDLLYTMYFLVKRNKVYVRCGLCMRT